MREPFPFADQSVATIYSEHLLDYIEYPTALNHLLRESLRVLKPGGMFSAGVPDLGEALHQH